MPGTLPTVFGNYSCSLPLRRSSTFVTRINQFQNGSEQRYKLRAVLGSLELNYINIDLADRLKLDAFVAQQKASSASDWSFAFDPTATFVSCAFEQDRISWTENYRSPRRYNGTIRFRQVAAGGIIQGANKGGFPALGPLGLCVTQFPYISSNLFSVSRVDLPTGPRYSFPWYGAGLTNCPDRPLKAWALTFSMIDVKTLALIEQHFVGCGGRYRNFAFVDPTDKRQYTRVRYDMDSLDISCTRPGAFSTQVKLVENYGPNWQSAGAILGEGWG